MSGNKSEQYKGRLTPEQVAAGMNAALRNAKRLAEDAALLFANKRFASATALAILAIEEAGKSPILRGLATAKTDKELKDKWREYRLHTSKNRIAIFPDLVASGARRLEDFVPMFAANADHPKTFDQLKQSSLYSDCLANAQWLLPEDVIDESVSRKAVETAKSLPVLRTVTAREIELWITHVGPRLDDIKDLIGKNATEDDFKVRMELAKQGLETYHAELQREGLMPEGPNAMSQFVRDGLKAST